MAKSRLDLFSTFHHEYRNAHSFFAKILTFFSTGVDRVIALFFQSELLKKGAFCAPSLDFNVVGSACDQVTAHTCENPNCKNAAFWINNVEIRGGVRGAKMRVLLPDQHPCKKR